MIYVDVYSVRKYVIFKDFDILTARIMKLVYVNLNCLKEISVQRKVIVYHFTKINIMYGF